MLFKRLATVQLKKLVLFIVIFLCVSSFCLTITYKDPLPTTRNRVHHVVYCCMSADRPTFSRNDINIVYGRVTE